VQLLQRSLACGRLSGLAPIRSELADVQKTRRAVKGQQLNADWDHPCQFRLVCPPAGRIALRPHFFLDLFQPLKLRLGGVVFVERVTAGNHPVARRGRAIAERPMNRVGLPCYDLDVWYWPDAEAVSDSD
jgi:hypothetical protein